MEKAVQPRDQTNLPSPINHRIPESAKIVVDRTCSKNECERSRSKKMPIRSAGRNETTRSSKGAVHKTHRKKDLEKYQVTGWKTEAMDTSNWKRIVRGVYDWQIWRAFIYLSIDALLFNLLTDSAESGLVGKVVVKKKQMKFDKFYLNLSSRWKNCYFSIEGIWISQNFDWNF